MTIHTTITGPGRCGSYERKKCYEAPAVVEALSGIQAKVNQALTAQVADKLP